MFPLASAFNRGLFRQAKLGRNKLGTLVRVAKIIVASSWQHLRHTDTNTAATKMATNYVLIMCVKNSNHI